MHYLLKTQALYNPSKGTIGPALVEIQDQRIAAVYEPDHQEAMGSQANIEDPSAKDNSSTCCSRT